MRNFLDWIGRSHPLTEGMVGKNELGDYRGLHQAPGPDGGSPLYDVTKNGTYPDDFYSSNAIRYYGDGQSFDGESIYLVQSLRGKPNASVKIYRAVPKVITNQEKIADLQKQMAYILKYGRMPRGANSPLSPSKHYDQISNELEHLNSQSMAPEAKVTINQGDWVTISRSYAQMHGYGTLQGQSRILTKTVKAKDLYTDGNSIHEWGYFPS